MQFKTDFSGGGEETARAMRQRRHVPCAIGKKTVNSL